MRAARRARAKVGKYMFGRRDESLLKEPSVWMEKQRYGSLRRLFIHLFNLLFQIYALLLSVTISRDLHSSHQFCLLQIKAHLSSTSIHVCWWNEATASSAFVFLSLPSNKHSLLTHVLHFINASALERVIEMYIRGK